MEIAYYCSTAGYGIHPTEFLLYKVLFHIYEINDFFYPEFGQQ
jgi:hypothetical protein